MRILSGIEGEGPQRISSIAYAFGYENPEELQQGLPRRYGLNPRDVDARRGFASGPIWNAARPTWPGSGSSEVSSVRLPVGDTSMKPERSVTARFAATHPRRWKSWSAAHTVPGERLVCRIPGSAFSPDARRGRRQGAFRFAVDAGSAQARPPCRAPRLARRPGGGTVDRRRRSGSRRSKPRCSVLGRRRVTRAPARCLRERASVDFGPASRDRDTDHHRATARTGRPSHGGRHRRPLRAAVEPIRRDRSHRSMNTGMAREVGPRESNLQRRGMPDVGHPPLPPGPFLLVGILSSIGRSLLGHARPPTDLLPRRIHSREVPTQHQGLASGERAQASERRARTAAVTSATASVRSASTSIRSSNPEPLQSRRAPAPASRLSPAAAAPVRRAGAHLHYVHVP